MSNTVCVDSRHEDMISDTECSDNPLDFSELRTSSTPSDVASDRVGVVLP